MEKIRNKKGQVASYREKVYVNGKAVSKTFKRRSDAAAWKRNFDAEMKKREALGIDHIQSTDFESFSQEWIQMKKDMGVSNRTLDSYRSALKVHLLPVLGAIRLEKITEGKAQQVVRHGRGKGLGAARINLILTVLKHILSDAVKLDRLIRSPLKEMKKLKLPPRSLTYWLPDEAEKFLAANTDDPLYSAYLLALNTGMRRGELMGLCWDRVNLGERRIEISRIRDRYGVKDTTKTGLIRHLPLNDTAWELLDGLSRRKKHESYVIAHKGGSLPDLTHLSSRDFNKAIKRAGVTKIRFHDLRTTYASNFVMAGGDIFALSKLLGHTSVEMTAKKYAALHPRFMKDVVQTVQFGGNKNSPSVAS